MKTSKTILAICLLAMGAMTGNINAQPSVPLADGKWIIAAAKSEKNDAQARKNTIVLWRADNPDVINDRAEEICTIGMARGPGDEFYESVEFEVHGITELQSLVKLYILCGSISLDEDTYPVGMVAILDAQLKLVSLRYYREVRTFYSVYAQGSFYFVCGQMQPLYNNAAIVLRDNIAAPEIAPNIMGFYTPNGLGWAFHKITAKKDADQVRAFEFDVQYQYADYEQALASRQKNESKTNNTSPNPSKRGEQAPSLSERAGGEVQTKKISFTVPTTIFEDRQSMKHEITLPNDMKTADLTTFSIARIYIRGYVLPPLTKTK